MTGRPPQAYAFAVLFRVNGVPVREQAARGSGKSH